MVGVRIPLEWKKELEAIAKRERKPLSHILQKLIADFLGKQVESAIDIDVEDLQYQLQFIQSQIAELTPQQELTALSNQIKSLEMWQLLVTPDIQLITALSAEIQQLVNSVKQINQATPQPVHLIVNTPLKTLQELNRVEIIPSLQVPSSSLEIKSSTEPVIDISGDWRIYTDVDEMLDDIELRIRKNVLNQLPQHLSAKTLSQRLGVTEATLQTKQTMPLEAFAVWSLSANKRYGKLADPDGLAWCYNLEKKRYYSINPQEMD